MDRRLKLVRARRHGQVAAGTMTRCAERDAVP
jgi:hypothetical protein